MTQASLITLIIGQLEDGLGIWYRAVVNIRLAGFGVIFQVEEARIP